LSHILPPILNFFLSLSLS